MALSKKQQLFIIEYLQTFNATDAALNAGYSPKTAYSIGHENLRKPEIAKVVQERIETSAMTADQVLARLGQQAKNEASQYITDDGNVNLPALLEDGKAHLIKGIKDTKYGKQVELYDSQTALITLAKHHGLLTDVLKIKLQDELDSALSLLEQSLDQETYNRVLTILAGAG